MPGRRVSGLLTLVGIVVLLVVSCGTDQPARPNRPPAPTGAVLPLGQTGRWITDAAGRVVILHGLNEVYKVAPYTPSSDGFGSDDAAFLAANGFDAVRLGVIWAAVEPQPGRFDDRYLASLADTVRVLAGHGIVALLDFHQDLYNEAFQGEGAPAWAVQDGGQPNPELGFPANYFNNPALKNAFDQFWSNAPGPDGIGLEDHLAAAWAHVAGYFRDNAAVFGYELLNEPWPGTPWPACADTHVGCPDFDTRLTVFYQRVDTAIRRADPAKTIWFEPNLLFDVGVPTHLGTVADPRTGLAFHVYCATESVSGRSDTCPAEDGPKFANAQTYTAAHGIPELLTEFGATNDLTYLAQVIATADRDQVSWLEWAYGKERNQTSQEVEKQALVYDPAQPPTGPNVNTAKLATLAEPYPRVVAGTPVSWSFTNGTFQLVYTTRRADGTRAFPAGAETDIALPAVHFPNGYVVEVDGAKVATPASATVLRLLAQPGASRITVTVTPGKQASGGVRR
ncbi:cellulase family glycosylhydrolase [Frankia sp. AgB1.9]|uniref:cellulase family glycosylhydrolase n=1 Tax=unclassified Frankia TaxID=2632575 RepID=UPI00193399FE|nr:MULTISPECIES: cellulase family glycosylhydrolase [unclassified Frankia]MBL7487758.1 cellulase family glycosylhydrolase [Frankia sp. AgW1.1]MBL7547999.1 cellulase family glycosylhydrolase [Frankia sp. AgB1.9]MBL7622724.1 cellulase family glycosylhydrolase [Frankia sp. AgB1.8]